MNINNQVLQTIGRLTVEALGASAQAEALAESRERAYELLAECIRSDTPPDAIRIIEADPDFAAWYGAKFPTPDVNRA